MSCHHVSPIPLHTTIKTLLAKANVCEPPLIEVPLAFCDDCGNLLGDFGQEMKDQGGSRYEIVGEEIKKEDKQGGKS